MDVRAAVIALFITGLMVSVAAIADDVSELLPKIPAAKGDQCVEPTEVMRRQHMDFIMHQRDLTVHDGIRTEKHRFVNCIDCHVRPNKTGDYPRHTSNEHFCTTCHQFASVSIDCFQCHADRPPEAINATASLQRLRQISFLNRLQQLSEHQDDD